MALELNEPVPARKRAKVIERAINAIRELRNSIKTLPDGEAAKARSYFETLNRRFDDYWKRPTLGNAIGLSYAAETAYMHLNCRNNKTALLRNYIVDEIILKSRTWKAKKAAASKSLRGIDPRRVYITKDDADHLIRLTMEKKIDKSGYHEAVEYGGGARIERRGENARLKFVFGNAETYVGATIVPHRPFLETKVNVIWHTHSVERTALERALNSPRSAGPSADDLATARTIGMPVLLAEQRNSRLRPMLIFGKKRYVLKIKP